MNELQKQILNNFENDIRDHILANLDAKYLTETYDISLNPKSDLTKLDNLGLFTLYYFFRRRFPTGIKRVLHSRALLQNPLFNKYRKQVNKITAALNTGQSIREYLPDDIVKLNRCNPVENKMDGLLIGWGIAHLHLFTRKERVRLKAENQDDDKYLLYIISDSCGVFFIDIKDHMHFADTELLNIINEEITGGELKGFCNIQQIVTPTNLDKRDLNKLRKKGIGYLVKLNETGDTFISGLNRVSATMAYDQILHQLSGFAEWLTDNIEMLKQDLIKHNRYKDQIDFHLGFGQGGKCGKYMLPDVFLYDKNSDTIITIPDNQPIEMVINILKCNNMI